MTDYTQERNYTYIMTIDEQNQIILHWYPIIEKIGLQYQFLTYKKKGFVNDYENKNTCQYSE